MYIILFQDDIVFVETWQIQPLPSFEYQIVALFTAYLFHHNGLQRRNNPSNTSVVRVIFYYFLWIAFPFHVLWIHFCGYIFVNSIFVEFRISIFVMQRRIILSPFLSLLLLFCHQTQSNFKQRRQQQANTQLFFEQSSMLSWLLLLTHNHNSNTPLS